MPDSVKYMIITRAGFSCTWCEKAAELLDEQGFPYCLRPLSRKQLLAEATRANMSSIPIIYHGVKLVGGFSELEQYLYQLKNGGNPWKCT